jgi:hypothetical protein
MRGVNGSVAGDGIALDRDEAECLVNVVRPVETLSQLKKVLLLTCIYISVLLIIHAISVTLLHI